MGRPLTTFTSTRVFMQVPDEFRAKWASLVAMPDRGWAMGMYMIFSSRGALQTRTFQRFLNDLKELVQRQYCPKRIKLTGVSWNGDIPTSPWEIVLETSAKPRVRPW